MAGLETPMKSILRRANAHLTYFHFARRQFGLTFAVSSLARSLRRGHAELPIEGGRFVLIRTGTTDTKVYKDIWIDKAYAPIGGSPAVIVDAGGHIGLAAAYFATRYPSADIYVIEPDDANFAMLTRNTEQFPNVHRIKAGLWGEHASLHISNPDASPWAFSLRAGGDIEGVTVPDVLEMSGRHRIDLLKMDIEGAEIEVLESAQTWIHRVDALAVELHDRYRPGCTAALEHAVAGQAFTRQISGEYTLLIRPH
jgi:FkbM family methyltransferase